MEFGHLQAAAPHWWGMLQLARRAQLVRPSCARMHKAEPYATYFLSSAKCGSSDTFRGAAFRATVNVTGTSAERTHCVIVRPLAMTISTGTVAVKSLSTPDCVTVPLSRRFGATPFTVQLSFIAGMPVP